MGDPMRCGRDLDNHELQEGYIGEFGVERLRFQCEQRVSCLDGGSSDGKGIRLITAAFAEGSPEMAVSGKLICPISADPLMRPQAFE